MTIYSNPEHYKIWVDSKAKEFCFQLNGKTMNAARFKTSDEAIAEAEKLCHTKE